MSRNRIVFCATTIMSLLIPAGCAVNKTSKIFYINSYHSGYGSSDRVEGAIRRAFAGEGFELTVFHMEAKRDSSEQHATKKAAEAIGLIRRIEPDVVIASDDPAAKYVIAEHLKDTRIPCVFCGVNWSCEQYGLPAQNVTGILEVLPVEQAIEVLRQYYPGIRKLTVLSEDTVSEQKNIEYLEKLCKKLNLDVSYILVNDYHRWKEEFIRANAGSDVIFLPTNGAIKGWNDEDAKEFVRSNITVPVFTCDDFMMPYAALGLTKVAEEQGRWAAQTALRILSGVSPGDIAVARNRQVDCWINRDLAGKINFEPDENLLDKCKVIE